MSHLHFSLALVTGATSGIGEALCQLLADKKIPLIISGRNQPKLESLKKELTKQNIDVTIIAADLAHANERQKIIKLIHERSPDLVVNNAGFGLYGAALTHPTQAQMDILNVNGNAVLEISLEAARTLASNNRKGIIMNVSSAGAFQVFPSLAVYAAAKTFVNQVSQALDAEMKSYGVRILSACPGMVETEFAKRAAGSQESPNLMISMTPSEAARQIWWQIENEKPVHIFDWRTRWATYLSRCLPTSLVTKIIRSTITSRTPKRPIINIHHRGIEGTEKF